VTPFGALFGARLSPDRLKMSDQHVYSPAVFDVNSIEEAMAIILTPEGGSTEERWQKETPILTEYITQKCGVTSDSVVLDYGCGIGRIAKALIERHGCKVIGVDISPSMRALAAVYVNHPNFVACAPEMLSTLGLQCDTAFAVWVLQHCLRPAADVANIHAALKDQGSFFVLNNFGRAIPTNLRGWVDDGQNIDEIIANSGFLGGESGKLPKEVGPSVLIEGTFWRTYKRA
jgi:SAM-dependent methyltransferase